MNDKSVTKPPYTSYRSFENLLKEFRDHQVLPGVVDRSVLKKRSGSEQSALIATLKWFGLVDDASKPTPLLQELVNADEEEARGITRRMIESSYDFMSDGTVNLNSATTQQMADRFRQYEISGSTLTKSVAFFLGAAKEAGISLSPHVRAPAAPVSATGKKRSKSSPPIDASKNAPVEQSLHGSLPVRAAKPGRIHIPIPIFGMQDGVVDLPDNMDERQWSSVIKMTEYILKNYRDTMASPSFVQEEESDQ
ncbi:hypothetical protein LMG3458_02781 [Achromobacter deleyi]|uniref:DUF5343 domain-containing protein n=1 Tax=Achromobacter deleyi TaxID=1353891 RepID=A0A6S6ZZW9_9BURK|nr:DUF5343 domain-containing protein [Achromobacter deleyi]CAB3703379.1 hypothetical protein LMG3458_02781 [Achromobacter deleyi]CAB3857589.1 hypothetical protein LMG3482_02099 [Achromobacter deleyi]CAB3884658.1 hypothetical protein LMG3481_03441 [Achromobacter deleyi]